MAKLGYTSKKTEQAVERQAERIVAKFARNDALFSSDAFRDFLTDLANRSLYFRSLTGLTDESRTAALTLRDIVSGIVVNSSRGAEWLRDYAAHTAVKPQPEKPE